MAATRRQVVQNRRVGFGWCVRAQFQRAECPLAITLRESCELHSIDVTG
jgi:hypothetical protein